MKKVLAAALCGAVMFLLPGCGGERLPYAREMGDMALMRTMGVDTGEGGAEQLHVTVSSGRRARGLQGEAEPAPGPLCGAGVHQQRLPGHAGAE